MLPPDDRASLARRLRPPTAPLALPPAGPTPAQAAAGNGTVVLNVDSGIVVPSFMGKSLRSAVEVAQQSGLEINVLGSGIARQQSPSARQPSAHGAEGHDSVQPLTETVVPFWNVGVQHVQTAAFGSSERSYNAGRMNFLQLLDGAEYLDEERQSAHCRAGLRQPAG